MPKYKNSSKYNRIVGNTLLVPGETKNLLVYYNIKSLDGVEIVGDCPYFSPIVFSDKIEKERVVEIPKFDAFNHFIERFNIHFYVEEGEVIINYNVKDNNTPLKLYSGAKWNIRCVERLIDKFYIKSTTSKFKLWVIIQRT